MPSGWFDWICPEPDFADRPSPSSQWIRHRSLRARHLGLELDDSLVVSPAWMLVPGQAAVVAAVRGWVARGQAALTLVELPGLRGSTASHQSDSTPDQAKVNA